MKVHRLLKMIEIASKNRNKMFPRRRNSLGYSLYWQDACPLGFCMKSIRFI
jgi:hypothetical protein